MNLFFVGRHNLPVEENQNDDSIQGIFDSEAKATLACRSDYYYIIKFILNENLKEEPEVTECKYPLRDNKWQKYLDGVEID